MSWSIVRWDARAWPFTNRRNPSGALIETRSSSRVDAPEVEEGK